MFCTKMLTVWCCIAHWEGSEWLSCFYSPQSLNRSSWSPDLVKKFKDAKLLQLVYHVMLVFQCKYDIVICCCLLVIMKIVFDRNLVKGVKNAGGHQECYFLVIIARIWEDLRKPGRHLGCLELSHLYHFSSISQNLHESWPVFFRQWPPFTRQLYWKQ